MEGERVDRRLIALAAVAALPLLILAVRAPSQHWVPIGDSATIGMRVREVFTTDPPLVGAYSKYGWSHPGPLLFYLQAVPYRLLGSNGDALLVGSVLVNLAALVVLARTLLRVAGTAFAVAALACTGLAMWTLGASWLWFTWNPNLALLAFAAYLALAWSVSLGALRDLPWLAAFGTFTIQAHVGYALVVTAVAVAAVVLCRNSRRRTTAGSRAPARRPVLVTVLVLSLLWLPPVVDALRHRGGNLRAIAGYFLAGHEGAGWRTAGRIMGLALSERAPWLGFAEPTKLADILEPRGTPIPWALLLLVAATVVAVRRRDVLARNLCVICLVAIVVGLVSLSRIVGEVYVYMVFWTRVIAAFTWVTAIWTLARATTGRARTEVRRSGPIVAGVSAVVVVILLSVSALGAGIGSFAELTGRHSADLARVVPGVDDALGDASKVSVSAPESFYGGTFRSGLELALAQDGFDVTPGGDDAVHLEVVSGSEEILARRAEGRVPIASSGPPVRAPRDLPPRPDDEDMFDYLDRLEQIAPAKFRVLVRALDTASPVAVYRAAD